MDSLFCVVDIEATNTSPNYIIEIALLVYKKDNQELKLIDEFSSFIQPPLMPSSEILNLTGIIKEDLVNAPQFYEVAEKINWMTKNSTLIAHNVEFDYDILKSHFEKLGISFQRKTFCTLKKYQELFPSLPKHDLNSLAQWFSIQLDFQHRALDDAKACAELFKRFFDQERLRQQPSPLHSLEQLFPKASLLQLLRNTHPYNLIFYYQNEQLIFIDYTISFSENIHLKLKNFPKSLAKKITQISLLPCFDPIETFLRYESFYKEHKPLLNKTEREQKWVLNFNPKKDHSLSVRKLSKSHMYILQIFDSKTSALSKKKKILSSKEVQKYIYRDPLETKEKPCLNKQLIPETSYLHKDFILEFKDSCSSRIYIFRSHKLRYFKHVNAQGDSKTQKINESFWLKHKLIHFLNSQKSAKVKLYNIKQLKKKHGQQPRKFHTSQSPS